MRRCRGVNSAAARATRIIIPHDEPTQAGHPDFSLAYLGCAFLLFAVSFPIFGWPAAFGWLVIAPIVAVAWVARVRTTVTPDGLEVRRLFGGRSLAWSEITGFRFPGRGWARATLTDGAR